MMINCPNCNLLQPKDQYCAQCGVNMETWKPPRKPIWQRLLGNWMVQLGILFSIVFMLVFYDSITNQPDTDYEENLPPVADHIEREDDSTSFAASSSNQELESVEGRMAQNPQRSQKRLEKLGVKEGQQVQLTTLKKQAYFRLALMGQNLIDKIAEKGQRIDGNAVVISESELKELSRSYSGDVKSMGQIRKNFNFGQPTQLFVGEEDLETGLNLGYFFQVSVNENSVRNNIRADVRAWSQLQLSGDLGSQATYDITLTSDSALVVVDPTVPSFNFSQEERSLFDASSRLRPLNSEAIAEDLADIVLVLAIK